MKQGSRKKTHVAERKIPLGIFSAKGKIFLVSRIETDGSHAFAVQRSSDGLVFSKRTVSFSITNARKKIPPEDVLSLRASGEGYLTAVITERKRTQPVVLAVSTSADKKCKVVASVPVVADSFTVRVDGKGRPREEYFSDGSIWRKVAGTAKKKKDSLIWSTAELVAFPRMSEFDKGSLRVLGGIETAEGFLTLYDSLAGTLSGADISLGAVLSDKQGKIISRTPRSLWQGKLSYKESIGLVPLGVVQHKKEIIVYWKDSLNNIISVRFSHSIKGGVIQSSATYSIGFLDRYDGNPIVVPTEAPWENESTFNPAALVDDEGTIHLLYRALGHDGISRMGYAKSGDGRHVNFRSSLPVFEPSPGFGLPSEAEHKLRDYNFYSQMLYTSGGGWSGSEDPRAVVIDGKVYVTYVAFEGWDSMRMALTSISLDDLKHRRWKWKPPVLMSPPGEVNKNWVIFPQKIHGKYAILHTIAPKISIEYVDSLDDWQGYIHSARARGPQPGRTNFWDSFLRGAGPPPIKTSLGWLLLYHAIDRRETGKYKLGAMILDMDNPTKVLYRSAVPILTPDMHYENDGKPGVVYASGLVEKNGKLYVYYGGADRVVCVAEADTDEFLKAVRERRQLRLSFDTIIF